MAPPCFFSVIAAHFCRGKSDGFHPPKRNPKSNKTPTYNWADFIRFRDEDEEVAEEEAEEEVQKHLT